MQKFSCFEVNGFIVIPYIVSDASALKFFHAQSTVSRLGVPCHIRSRNSDVANTFLGSVEDIWGCDIVLNAQPQY